MMLNKRQLGECFGVAEETITGWMAQGCPVESQGKGQKGNTYDSAKVFKWRLARAGDNRTASDLESERMGLVNAQRRLAELNLAEREGRMLDREQVAATVGEKIDKMCKRLYLIPKTAAPRIAPVGRAAEAQQILETLISEALTELKQTL